MAETEVSTRQIQLTEATLEQINAALLLLCEWINGLGGVGYTVPPGFNTATLIAGTTNRVTVTDDGDGTVTLTTPQDTHATASPQFTAVLATSAVKVYDASGSGDVLHGFGDVGV